MNRGSTIFRIDLSREPAIHACELAECVELRRIRVAIRVCKAVMPALAELDKVLDIAPHYRFLTMERWDKATVSYSVAYEAIFYMADEFIIEV